jgi:hypothetical protein
MLIEQQQEFCSAIIQDVCDKMGWRSEDKAI